MRSMKSVALSAVVSLAVVSTAFADVRCTIREGRVTIIAKDATVGEILAEWAKVGQTRVVNIELIPRDRVTIELRDVTEEHALAVVLRNASGYVAARRLVAVPDTSRFDRILVMAPSLARAPIRTAAAAPVRAIPPDQAAAEQAAADQAAAEEALANPTPANQKPAGRAPEARAPASQPLPFLTAEDQPLAFQTPGDRGPDPTPTAAMTEEQALARRAASRQPPERPMLAGQMVERRLSQDQTATRQGSAPPRDQRALPTAPGNQGVDVVNGVDGTNGVDLANAELPPPTAPVEVPTSDPRAQAAINARRALETVDPRDFKFKMPRPAAASPGGTVGPGVGSAVPGAPVKAPPPGQSVIKQDPIIR